MKSIYTARIAPLPVIFQVVLAIFTLTMILTAAPFVIKSLIAAIPGFIIVGIVYTVIHYFKK